MHSIVVYTLRPILGEQVNLDGQNLYLGYDSSQVLAFQGEVRILGGKFYPNSSEINTNA